MDQNDLKQAIGKPHILRLQQVGSGIKVGRVLGSRVLVKTVDPRTDLDRVEQEGKIIVPKWVKKENTPLPTTGVVLLVGPDIPCANCGRGHLEHNLYEGGGACDAGYSPSVQEGDMVMFPKFSGSDFNIENENLRIVETKEILCTLVDTQDSLVEAEGEENSLS